MRIGSTQIIKRWPRRKSEREDGIDFVSIVTPNFLHYQVAKEFLNHGINVLCEKPLSFEVGEAEELKALAEEKGLYFAVNYSYSGNNMVKEARELVKQGVIGDVINVNAEYLQEYLVDDIGQRGPEDGEAVLAGEKTRRLRGSPTVWGDIGTHIEHTVSYITGLKLKKVAAVLDNYGQPLDLNAKHPCRV